MNNNEQANEDIAEFTELEETTGKLLKRQLIMWAIRWTIGFGITWWIVTTWSNLTWLWWVAAAIALTSLTFILISFYILNRRLKQTEDLIHQAEKELE